MNLLVDVQVYYDLVVYMCRAGDSSASDLCVPCVFLS